MSYSWILPEALVPSAPAPSGPSSATARTTGVSGLLDQEVDPVTLDFIDTDDGEWAETADSRSIVLCQLEIELGKSIETPGDGTRIREQLENEDGEPVTTSFVESEIRRALSILENLGTLEGVQVSGRDSSGDQLVDDAGRARFDLAYIDHATGSPVDIVYRPLGG